jgi:hypothetical protein
VLVVDDLGAPSSYLVLEPGVGVYSSDAEKVGKVEHVLADDDLDIFDGIVIDTGSHHDRLRFADASQVDRIYEAGVVLTVSAADAARLPAPTDNPGVLEVTGVEDVDATELQEKLRRAWEIVSGKGLDKS